MLFNSWQFLGLVMATIIFYYLPILKKCQIYILLAASFLFYAYDNLWMLFLLLLSALINASMSYATVYLKHARWYAIVGVLSNLFILALFKYGGLLSFSFFNPRHGIGHLLCMLPLPLGVSFYTFSGISMVVDTYRGKSGRTTVIDISFFKHLRNTLLYICFFPKLLSGPIIKSKDFICQLKTKNFNAINWLLAFKTLVTGYFLKMVIADNLSDFTFWMNFRYIQDMSSGSLIVMMLGYSIQMFCDFAGYSLIAIGVAALFGYQLPTNFYFPYISSTFREFWKRWHITLSQFLMEYLYISLGGNRKGRTRTYINLLFTMMIGGLWHGAAWSYLVWGTYHGLCLVIERIFCGRRENCIQVTKGSKRAGLSKATSITFVFIMVSFGWLLFKMSFSEAVHYILYIFTHIDSIFQIESKFSPIILYIIPALFYHLIYYFRATKWVKNFVLRYEYIYYGAMLFFLVTNSGSPSSFVYFQF